MDIAVFGASGFVGRNLIDELSETDHRVTACDIEPLDPDAENISFEKVDILDEERVADILTGVDAVAHLAAHQLPESKEEPKLNAEINIIGSLNILDAARANEVEKVFFSSASSVVGRVEKNPVPEDHPVTPQSPYGVAKHAMEEYLEVYQDLYGLDYLVFRFFNVYGPHQHPESGALVPVVLSRLAQNQGVFVTGDGSQTRDFVYVRDITSFIVEGLEGEVKNEIVNMGTGTPTTIHNAIESMAEEVDVDPKIDRRPERPDEIDDFYADMSKCERLFGHAPSTPFNEGLTRTFDWLNGELD